MSDEDLAKLDPELLADIRRKTNPYGKATVPVDSDKFLTFSITNLSEKYMMKFLTTAIQGYLERSVDTYKLLPGLPNVSVYEYLQNPSLLDTPKVAIERKDKSVMHDFEFNRKMMQKRVIIKAFLEEMFQFHPDEHVRSAYKPNYGDPERKLLENRTAKFAVDHLRATDKEFAAMHQEHLVRTGQVAPMKTVKRLRKTKRTTKGKDGKITEEIIEKEYSVQVPDLEAQKLLQEVSNAERVEKIDAEIMASMASNDTESKDTKDAAAAAVTRETTTMIPPAELFHGLSGYVRDNYDALRDVVRDLYSEKPDLEFCIMPWAAHKTAEEAEKYRKQYADQTVATMHTAQMGNWTILADYKENVERSEFYNKETAIFEQMQRQNEADEKMGQDLMRKRVKKEKKKNVLESGPDSEGFTKWRSENRELKKLGAKNIGDMASDDTVGNVIESEIWKANATGLEMIREKIHLLSEAPTKEQAEIIHKSYS